jgi:RNA polymerase sigma-70 factor (ECF subfamily)
MATRFNDNDNTLFIKLGKGSQKDLMAVLERYFSPLLHYISRVVLNREIAKEIVMDAMETLWENRIPVAAMEKPYNWLQKCAFNGALKYLRIKNKNAFVVPLSEDFNPPAADKLEYGLEAKEFSDRIAVLIDQLPPRQKEIIRFKIYYNLTRKQIAGRLNISESSVKNQITEANKKLRKLMEDISKYYLLVTLVCLLMNHH